MKIILLGIALNKEKRDKDDYLKTLFLNAQKYKVDHLGRKLYKVRVARRGQGKSGSYRNIIFWESEKWIIAIYLRTGKYKNTFLSSPKIASS